MISAALCKSLCLWKSPKYVLFCKRLKGGFSEMVLEPMLAAVTRPCPAALRMAKGARGRHSSEMPRVPVSVPAVEMVEKDLLSGEPQLTG